MANFSPDNFQLSQLLAINEIHGFIVYKWIDPHPHNYIEKTKNNTCFGDD